MQGTLNKTLLVSTDDFHNFPSNNRSNYPNNLSKFNTAVNFIFLIYFR